MGQGLYIKVAQVVAEEFGVDAEQVKITATTTAQGAEHVGDRGLVRLRHQRHGGEERGRRDQGAADRLRGRELRYRRRPDRVPRQPRVHRQPLGAVRRTGQAGLFRARLAVVDRLLSHAEDPLGRARRAGAAVLLFRLRRGVLGGAGRRDDRRDEGACASTSSTTSAARSIRRSTSARSRAASCRAWAGSPPRSWCSTRTGGCSRHAPSTYKIPCASDVPEHFQITLWDGANREDTIYRSKAVGEPPLMLAISVFAAIADAIHSLDPAEPVPLDAPATPEAILRAVQAVTRTDVDLADHRALHRRPGRRRAGDAGAGARLEPARGRRPHGGGARRHVHRHDRRRRARMGRARRSAGAAGARDGAMVDAARQGARARSRPMLRRARAADDREVRRGGPRGGRGAGGGRAARAC